MNSIFIITFCITLVILLFPLIFENRSKSNINKGEKLKSYSDLLKEQEWQEKRLEILKRDNYKCKYCGSTKNLCVHHKYYLQYPNHKKVKPWNYPNDALITLCNKCHYRVHKNKQIKVYYKKYDTDF